MKTNFFGTDGIRGLYGQFPLTPRDMWSLGWAVGRWILEQGTLSPFVLIGTDTRASCAAIQEALTGGLVGGGVRVVGLGCVPTPAVSFLTRQHGASMGLMISASHNPSPYNGIKFFNTLGEKLSPDHEKEISFAIMQAVGKIGSGIVPVQESGLVSDYTDFLHTQVPYIGPLRLVIDCANGAYSAIAPDVLRHAGAILVDVLADSPDGYNINAACGSVYPERLCQSVLLHQADAGICFDGDGDRVILVNGQGLVQDGDQILAALAETLCITPAASRALPPAFSDSSSGPLFGHRNTRLDNGPDDTNHTAHASGVVGTVVSNLGLEHFLKEKHIPFVRTDVGDRWIGKKLKALHWRLGGEPCGHIILADALPTGDGLLAGLHVLEKLYSNPHLFPQFQPKPSAMRNITMHMPHFSQHPEFLNYYATLQASLSDQERVLLRASGTEPVMRILVEGPCQEQANHAAETIAASLVAQQKTLAQIDHA